MLLLTTQDKSTMIILDRLSAVVDINNYSDIRKNDKVLGLEVYTAKHKFIVCEKSVNTSNDYYEYNVIKDKLKQLKIDIVEAYRNYRDNLTINNFNDEYYYIDHDFKLQKVNSTKETL